nr:transposase [Xenorhabdus bovienii]
MDSTSIKVCHNLRIPRHKVFKETAACSAATNSALLVGIFCTH